MTTRRQEEGEGLQVSDDELNSMKPMCVFNPYTEEYGSFDKSLTPNSQGSGRHINHRLPAPH